MFRRLSVMVSCLAGRRALVIDAMASWNGRYKVGCLDSGARVHPAAAWNLYLVNESQICYTQSVMRFIL